MENTSDKSTPSATLYREDQHNVPVLDTVLVIGNLESFGKDPLKLYFNNKRKCGGEGIISIVVQQDKAFITFIDINGTNNNNNIIINLSNTM